MCFLWKFNFRIVENRSQSLLTQPVGAQPPGNPFYAAQMWLKGATIPEDDTYIAVKDQALASSLESWNFFWISLGHWKRLAGGSYNEDQ